MRQESFPHSLGPSSPQTYARALDDRAHAIGVGDVVVVDAPVGVDIPGIVVVVVTPDAPRPEVRLYKKDTFTMMLQTCFQNPKPTILFSSNGLTKYTAGI